MVNLLLTTYCNNNCPYCFAKNKVEIDRDVGINSEQITLENARYVAKFFKKHKYMGLLGGEPTLHPQFGEIVDIFLNEGYRVNIFTNGLFSQKVLDFVRSRPKDKISFLFNINNPELQGEKRWERLNYNLTELYNFYEGKPNFSVGINIYKLDQEFNYILDIAKKYNVKKIRWDIAHPIIREKNSFIPLEKYSEIAPRINAFMKKCLKEKIIFGPDCGSSAPCMFSFEMLKDTYSLGIRKMFDVCTHGGAIDIGIDLNVWRCFPLAKFYNKNLKEFKDLQGIYTYFNEKYKPYFFNYYPMDKCYDCDYAIRKQCVGTCISRAIIKNVYRESRIFKNYYFPVLSKIENKKIEFRINNKTLQKRILEKNILGDDLIITDLVHNFDLLKYYSYSNGNYFPTKINIYANFINSKVFKKYPILRKTRNVSEKDFIMKSVLLKEIILGEDDNCFEKEFNYDLKSDSTNVVLYYKVYFDDKEIFNSLEDFAWVYPLKLLGQGVMKISALCEGLKMKYDVVMKK